MGFENVRERGLCSLSPIPLAFLNMLKNIWEIKGHILEIDRVPSRGEKDTDVSPNVSGAGQTDEW